MWIGLALLASGVPPPRPLGPRPEWADLDLFRGEAEGTIYAVGSVPFDVCSERLLVATAEGRALEHFVRWRDGVAVVTERSRLVTVAGVSEVRIHRSRSEGRIVGRQAIASWLDDERFYQLFAIPAEARGLYASEPRGGAPLARVMEHVRRRCDGVAMERERLVPEPEAGQRLSEEDWAELERHPRAAHPIVGRWLAQPARHPEDVQRLFVLLKKHDPAVRTLSERSLPYVVELDGGEQAPFTRGAGPRPVLPRSAVVVLCTVDESVVAGYAARGVFHWTLGEQALGAWHESASGATPEEALERLGAGLFLRTRVELIRAARS